MTSIATIIVNYGTAALAAEAVDSVLARRHGGRSMQVHVVDNGSPGDDAAQLRAAHEQRHWSDRVTLYLENQNHGFGRGNNVVLEALRAAPQPPDLVFLLNPDAQLANEAVAILADFLDAHPQAVAAGPALQRPDGSAVSAAFRFPGPMTEFVGAAGLGVICRLLPDKVAAIAPEPTARAVDWVTGAAFLVRFDQLIAAGFFDPDFFLYFEETELMWRLRQSGHEIWHVPEAHVQHVAGAATGMQGGRHKNRARPAYWYDSWRLYHVKTRGKGAARMAALASIAASALNIGASVIRGRATSVPAHFFRDFARNVLKPLFLGDPLMARPDGRTVKARDA